MDVNKFKQKQWYFGSFTVATFLVLAWLPLSVNAAGDEDGDGISDAQDNCIEIANPDQRDSNGDDFGNICDADLDNNGLVSFADLHMFRTAFDTNNADADFDGNGIVSFADLDIFRSLFDKQPGPSGTIPAEKYRYDSLGRLTQVIYGNGRRIGYTYDDVGNRIEKRL